MKNKQCVISERILKILFLLTLIHFVKALKNTKTKTEIKNLYILLA